MIDSPLPIQERRSPTVRLFRALWLWCVGIAFGLGAVVSGCQCISIVQLHPSFDASPQQGQQTTEIPEPRTKPFRYSIHGVAMVAFYPGFAKDGVLDPTLGTANGYVMVYETPQETTIAAWALEDGECAYSQTPKKETETSTFRGLDGGIGLFVHIDGTQHTFERRLATTPTQPPAHPDVIYNLPTISNYQFPYRRTVRFSSTGGQEIPAFHIELPAPSLLRIHTPTLVTAGLQIKRDDGLLLRWTTEGEMPYVAIRINQSPPNETDSRSLLCRFANTGEATIPSTHWNSFAPDPKAAFTRIYFSPTSYKLAPVEGIPKPILAIVRATTTLPVSIP